MQFGQRCMGMMCLVVASLLAQCGTIRANDQDVVDAAEFLFLLGSDNHSFKYQGRGYSRPPFSIDDAIAEAESGDGYSQFSLAVTYFNGAGVEKNDAEALRWMQRAAQSDLDWACCTYIVLAIIAEGGQDYLDDALKYCTAYSEDGYREARNNLAICYALGIGVEKNPEKAVDMFQSANNANLFEGVFNLGLCYLKGVGVEQSDEKAEERLRTASFMSHDEREAKHVRPLLELLEQREKDGKEKAERERREARDREEREKREQAESAERQKQAAIDVERATVMAAPTLAGATLFTMPVDGAELLRKRDAGVSADAQFSNRIKELLAKMPGDMLNVEMIAPPAYKDKKVLELRVKVSLDMPAYVDVVESLISHLESTAPQWQNEDDGGMNFDFTTVASRQAAALANETGRFPSSELVFYRISLPRRYDTYLSDHFRQLGRQVVIIELLDKNGEVIRKYRNKFDSFSYFGASGIRTDPRGGFEFPEGGGRNELVWNKSWVFSLDLPPEEAELVGNVKFSFANEAD
ncbi:MAG: sel1 repeat family protein [Planctomycetes bacterium]|nr:sel1 repeat family protein [Planctomycetota bacterium]